MHFDGLNLISFIYAPEHEILRVIMLPVIPWLCEQLWPIVRPWLVNKALSLVTRNETPKGVGNMSRSERRRALQAAAAGSSPTSSAVPSRLLGAPHSGRLRARSNRSSKRARIADPSAYPSPIGGLSGPCRMTL